MHYNFSQIRLKRKCGLRHSRLKNVKLDPISSQIRLKRKCGLCFYFLFIFIKICKQANKWARKKISSFFWLESINIDKLSIFNQQWKLIRRETYVKESYFIINFMYKYSNMQDFFPFLFQRKKKQRSTERNLTTKKWTLQRRYKRRVL